MVYQDLALCKNPTAAANAFLGCEMMRGSGPFRWLDHKAMAKRAEVLFRELQSETWGARLGRADVRAGNGKRWRSRARASPMRSSS